MIWDSMTPEFPLAPIRAPMDAVSNTAFVVGFLRFNTSSLTDLSVISILVPVSPSGTGNTFISFIFASFLLKSPMMVSVILSSKALSIIFAISNLPVLI